MASNRLAARSLIVLASLATALAAAEWIARASGARPFDRALETDAEPTMHAEDPVLGWRNLEGRYELATPRPRAPKVRVTMWPNGRRATASERVPRDRRVVVLGCSFTMGWAISDEETYAWKLQERLPAHEVFNYGTAGYNELQMLLALERHYAEVGGAELVVLGFSSVHETRNVARPDWLRALARASKRNTVRVPWASLDANGALVRHPPLGYPLWPMRESSALVELAQSAWARARIRDEDVTPERMQDVAVALVEAIARTAREHGSAFLVAVLGSQPYVQPYRARFEALSLPQVYCEPDEYTPDDYVPWDGHPSARQNAMWAERIFEALPASVK